jgi:hypothetical protein
MFIDVFTLYHQAILSAKLYFYEKSCPPPPPIFSWWWLLEAALTALRLYRDSVAEDPQ